MYNLTLERTKRHNKSLRPILDKETKARGRPKVIRLGKGALEEPRNGLQCPESQVGRPPACERSVLSLTWDNHQLTMHRPFLICQ